MFDLNDSVGKIERDDVFGDDRAIDGLVFFRRPDRDDHLPLGGPTDAATKLLGELLQEEFVG